MKTYQNIYIYQTERNIIQNHNRINRVITQIAPKNTNVEHHLENYIYIAFFGPKKQLNIQLMMDATTANQTYEAQLPLPLKSKAQQFSQSSSGFSSSIQAADAANQGFDHYSFFTCP